uniref:Uncharacterized protein n=1 Tax=Tetraselmis sp. GSL018 TaxID=582737 RepID=A0A061SCC2_9CHLO
MTRKASNYPGVSRLSSGSKFWESVPTLCFPASPAFNLGSVSRSKTSPESTASEATAVAPVCAVWCFISSRKYLSSWAKNIFDRQTQERYFPSQAVLSSLSIYLDYQLQSFPETEDYIKYTAEGEGGLKE